MLGCVFAAMLVIAAAILGGDVDVRQRGRELGIARERTHLRVGRERVSDLERFHARRERLVRQRTGYIQPGRASEAAPGSSLRRASPQ